MRTVTSAEGLSILLPIIPSDQSMVVVRTQVRTTSSTRGSPMLMRPLVVMFSFMRETSWFTKSRIHKHPQKALKMESADDLKNVAPLVG